MTGSTTGPTTPPTTNSPEPQRLSLPRARGLTLLSILAVALSPFSIPTFGVGAALGVFLIIAGALLERRKLRARGPIAAGIVALVLSAVSAGACGWFVLRPAEVKGREERRQDRVEDRFDEAFKNSDRPPTRDGGDQHGFGVDAGGRVDADSATPRVEDR